MQKPLDPLSVERVRTLPASYVLRRRYGPARHVIAVASWVTVINMLLQPVTVLAATQYWDTSTTGGHQGGSGTWDTSGAAYWGDLAGTAALVDWTTSNEAVLDAGTATVVTLGGNNITAGVIQIGNSNFTIAQNASADRTLTYTRIESSAGSGTQILTLSAASGRTLTLGSLIQNGSSGGTIALTKTGTIPTGTLVLSGANTFSGGVIHKAGGVRIGHDTGLGTGTFQIGDSAGTTAVTFDAATADRTINNALTIYQNFTHTGTYNLSQGTGAITLYKAPSITVTAKTLTLGGLIDDGASSFGLTNAGAGNLVLSNTGNTFGSASVISLTAGGLYTAYSAGADALGAANNTITVNGGGIGYSTTGTYNIADNESFNGRTVINTQYGWAAGDGVTMNINEAMTDAKAVNIFGYGTGKVVSTGANSYTGLTTINSGTLVLAGSNSGTGGTTLAAGATLQFDGSTSNPLASGTLVLNAGTVQALNAGHVINNTTTIAAQTTPCTFSGDYAMEFSGTVTDITSASTTIASSITGGNTLTFSGQYNLMLPADGTPRKLIIQGTGNTTFSGTIANGHATFACGFECQNTGTTTLSGVNTYSGETQMNAAAGTLVLAGSNSTSGTTKLTTGTLQFGGVSVNPLASGTLTLIAGTVQALNAGHVINNTTTFGHSITFSGANAMEFSGPVTIDGGGTENFTSSITGGNTLTFSNTVQFGVATQRSVTLFGTGNTTFSGPITQPLAGANLTIDNTGTTTLSNANTYTGTTTVKAGTLRLSHATALPGGIGATGGTSALKLDGGVVELGNGDFLRNLGATAAQFQFGTTTGSGGFSAYGADRTVNINNANATLTWDSNNLTGTLMLSSTVSNAKLIFDSPINLKAGATPTSRTIQVANGSAAIDASINRVISSSQNNANANLVKTGDGTLELAGSVTHTYGGTTTITAGTLLVNGTLDSQTSAVTVTSGATLGGTGTINRPVTVANGGTLRPGGNIGKLTVGADISHEAASIFAWEARHYTTETDIGTAGTDYSQVAMTAGKFTLASGTLGKLYFPTGEDFSGSFWDSNRTWDIITGGSSSSSGWIADSNIKVYVNNSEYDGGDREITAQGAFSTTYVVNGILRLTWTPATGGTVIMFR